MYSKLKFTSLSLNKNSILYALKWFRLFENSQVSNFWSLETHSGRPWKNLNKNLQYFMLIPAKL